MSAHRKSSAWVAKHLRKLFEVDLEAASEELTRKKKVLDFFLAPGKVQVKLQDENSRSFRIEFLFRQFSDDEWQIICRELSKQSLFLVSLLGGQLPEEITPVLDSHKIFILPKAPEDIQIFCNGEPVSAKTRNNAFAAFDRLLERLEEDPLSIFVLRGKGREELLLDLTRERQGLARPNNASVWLDLPEDNEEKAATPKIDPELFYKVGAEVYSLSYSIRADELPASILKRLEPLPLGGVEDLMDTLLEDAYAQVARRAQAYGLELKS